MIPILKKRKNLTIFGRVQGVGFRFASRSMARSLGIKGFVKNQPDGTVYIEAEGSEVQLRHFLEWCYKGPDYASISNIEIEQGELKNFQHFDIT